MKQKVMGPRETPTNLSSVGMRSQMGLTTDNELYYDKHVDNTCEGSGCSHLCVLRESLLGQNSQCLCPDKYSLGQDGRACVYDHSERDGVSHSHMDSPTPPTHCIYSSRSEPLPSVWRRCVRTRRSANPGRCAVAHGMTRVTTPVCG